MDKFIRRETDNQSEDFTSDSEDATSGTINEAEQPSTSKKRKISKIRSEYINYIKDNKCTVEECDQLFTSLKASNIKRHFERNHKDLFDQIESGELIKQQQKLNFPVERPKSKPARYFALYAATSTFPLYHVENKWLQRFASSHPDFNLPNRKQLSNMMDRELQNLVQRVDNAIKSTEFPISLSIDMATTKGMLRSFMGVCAHFFSKARGGIATVALDITEMTIDHTAQNISNELNRILEKHSIDLDKIFRIITDSAYNMKAAFREFGESSEIEILQQNESDSDTEKDELDPTAILENPNDGVLFIDEQLDYFSEISKHSTCAAHTIQLILKDVFEKQSVEARELKREVFSILSKFAHSHNATAELHRISGKKLILPSNTRWSSLYLTYARVIEVYEHLNTVAIKKRWPFINADQLKFMKEICELVQPFYLFQKKLQSESIPTISLLLPGLLQLKKHLNQSLDPLALDLEMSLNNRFKGILSIFDREFDEQDPIYIAAAVLDPSVAYLMAEHRNIAKLALMKIFRGNLTLNREVPEAIFLPTDEEEIESPFGFGIIKLKTPSGSSSQNCTEGVPEIEFELEIDKYFDIVLKGPIRDKSFEFWINKEKLFPLISKLAFKILPVPATSSSVERVFSQLTLATTGHKSQTKEKLIRRKIMLNFNEDFIQI